MEEKHYRPDGEHNGTTYLYGYDLGNRLLSLEKWGFETLVDTYAFTYDRLDRLTSETMNIEWLTHEIVLEHSYNQSSVRTELATSIGGTADLVNNYSYDGFNRLTQITQQGVSGGNAVAEKRVNFSYNAVDQLTCITRYAGLTTANVVATSHYGYDLLGRLQSLTHDLNNTGLTDITYAYSWDRANRLTGINFSHDPDVTFDYDPRSQLLGAEYTNPLLDEAYEYDATGNRDTLDHVVGPNNQLLEDADYVYTYHHHDALATRTHKVTGVRDEYAYAHHGQLVAVRTYDTSGMEDVLTTAVFYSYDPFGRLVRRDVDPDGAGPQGMERTFYVWDGDEVLYEFDLYGDLKTRYLNGPMIDMVLAQENVDSLLTEGEVLWLLGDHQGTIRDVVEYNETTNQTDHLEHYRYDSYGNLTEITEADGVTIISTDRGDALTTRQYTGRTWDDASELQYNRNRWYNPKTGLWLGEGPIGFAGGQENLVVYVGNNPVNFTDPWGLEKKKGGQTPLQPGQVAMSPEMMGGPSDIPDRLYGFWKVTVIAGPEHCWIRFDRIVSEQGHLGSSVTLGRYEYGSGGRYDDDGTTLIEPAAEPGVQNRDLFRGDDLSSEAYASRSVTVKDPILFKGDDPYSYGWWGNNCTTYARDAWHYYSGEWYSLPALDHPMSLRWQLKNIAPRACYALWLSIFSSSAIAASQCQLMSVWLSRS